jgi:hypothetical protein
MQVLEFNVVAYALRAADKPNIECVAQLLCQALLSLLLSQLMCILCPVPTLTLEA